MAFRRAAKDASKLRLALIGPSGSGKTWTALDLATALRAEWGGKIAVIDSERGSASLYADRFEFDVHELASYSPEAYVRAIREAVAGGYTIIIIDSLSHEWAGAEGVLAKVDLAAAKSGNKWAAWAVGTPAHNAFVDAMLQAPAHVIATMRAKTEWVLDERNKPKAVGMGAVARDGTEYEFSVAGLLSLEHTLTITKTRCPALDGRTLRAPAPELAEALMDWLDAGGPAPVVADAPKAQSPADAVLAQIAAAPDKAALDALVPIVAGLPDGALAAVRARWVARSRELTNGARP